MFINILANKVGGILVVAGDSSSQDLIFDPDCNFSEAVMLVSQLLKCAQNQKQFHPSDIDGLDRWTPGYDAHSSTLKP